MRRNEEYLPARRGWGSELSPWGQGGSFGSSFFGSSPWQTMRRMQEDMDRIFGQIFSGQGGPGTMAPAGQQTGMQAWAPSVDISQTDQEWLVEVELPGARREDIHTEIQDHHLIIRAEMRREEGTQPGQTQGQQGQQAGQAQGQQAGQGQPGQPGQPGGQRQYFHRERRYGFYQRVIPLPENIDEENVRCTFRDGVLTVQLPRMEQMASRGRRIPIGEGTEQRTTAGAKGGEVSATQQGAQQPGASTAQQSATSTTGSASQQGGGTTAQPGTQQGKERGK